MVQKKSMDYSDCFARVRISSWPKKKLYLRRKVHSKDIGINTFSDPTIDTRQHWISQFLYFVHLFLIALILLRSGDIEANPGPVGLVGICRGCGSTNIEEKECMKVRYFVENHLGLLEMAFHHGELLISDNDKNPKFFCNLCAKYIRGCHAKQKQNHAKRVKLEKKFLMAFLPSESDCDLKRCNHVEVTISDLKLQWQKASERTQCLMMAFIANDLKGKIAEDYTENVQKKKDGWNFC